VISRRAFFAVPAAAAFSACSQNKAAFSGYAFIANQDGGAITAIDLGVMAVVKHISVEGAPTQMVSAPSKAVYALSPATGSLYEIETETLKTARRVDVGPADAMYLSGDESHLYVLSRSKQTLYAVQLNEMRLAWRIEFPEVPVDFALSPDGTTAAVSSATTLRLVSLTARSLGTPLGRSNYGKIRFLKDGERLVAADLDHQQISVYRTHNPRLVAHLPIAVRPEHLCFNSDGGQLFVTGPGQDSVVILYPFNVPEVAETVLVGQAPEGMTASRDLIFITSPTSGNVSVLHVGTHKVIAVVPVGNGPGSVAITPDDRFALVLNRESGNVAVLDIEAIQPNRYKSAALLTVIPVGSRPVSAAIHA
jgi:YVTN family beta-propeller protein